MEGAQREVERRRLQAVPERAERGLDERALVPRALVAPPIDEKGRRARRAVAPRAFGVVVHALLRPAPRVLVLRAPRQAQARGKRVELLRRDSRAALHERVVRIPEEILRLARVFRELGRLPRPLVSGDRPVAEHVAHALAEAIAQARDHLVGRLAVRAVVASVLHQRDIGVVLAERMIGLHPRAI